ncbi:MAG: segregation/condensation protein A [Firmicutes bacterium]|nr:segregation/condensation protein A [Bacillota bacterium]
MAIEQAEYRIKLPTFEGPFDLLFHLIKKAEVDIWSISIAAITDQYLAYLQSMQELNLDIASEFLVMAATLLRLKSKLLLPKPVTEAEQEEEEDLFEIHSAEELFQRLEEYRFFKEVAKNLESREDEQRKIYLRSTGGQKVMVFTQQDSVYTIWEGADHLSDIMNRFAVVNTADQYMPFFNAVEDFIVTEKAASIAEILNSSKKPQPMEKFIDGSGIWEMIITFIALLEMARQKKIILLQEKLFGPIFVVLREENREKDTEDGQS